MKNKYKVLCVSSIMIALSFVLSFVKIWQMPLGGSVTLLSMVPVCMLSVLYGFRKSVIPCLTFGILQCLYGMIFEGSIGWVTTVWAFIGMAFFDYILAYGSACLCGLFRNKGFFGVMGGVILAFAVRYIFHNISGVIIFTCYDRFNNPLIWSLVYNGSFLLPEMVFTVIGVAVLYKISAFRKICELAKE